MLDGEAKNEIAVDTTSGSMAYNRLDMQASQVLHMAIELYDNLDYLFILDYYDDITLFEDENNPEVVSYYQMKTNQEFIQFNTAISEDWFTKMHAQLDRPDWIVKELGLITNCPIHVTISKTESRTGKQRQYAIDGNRTELSSLKPETIKKVKEDIAQKRHIRVEDVDLSKFVHIKTTLTIERHRDIVEKEMGDFLYKKYPKIGMDSIKTIYSTMMNVLTKKQEDESVKSDASFEEVRNIKGIGRSEVDRIIKRSMMQSLPEAYMVEEFFAEEEKDNALRAYSMITADNYKQDEILAKVVLQIEHIMEQNEITASESALDYCDRMIDIFAEKNKKISAIRNRMYFKVLCVCLYINDLRMI